MSQPECIKKQVLPQSGFTLLEVLLAIGITAMIGLGSWQILNSAIRASEATQERLAELNTLQKTMLIISRDLRQLLPRSIRDEFGDYQAALTSKNEFYLLEFSRNGWRNPMDDPRSNMQRVAYEFSDNKFIRHYWQILDRPQDAKPISKTLLEEVNSVSLRFMNESGGWLDEWPGESDASTANPNSAATTDPRLNDNKLPKAVEISFDLVRFGKLKRLYSIVSYLPNIDLPTANGNGGTGQADDGQTDPGQTDHGQTGDGMTDNSSGVNEFEQNTDGFN